MKNMSHLKSESRNSWLARTLSIITPPDDDESGVIARTSSARRDQRCNRNDSNRDIDERIWKWEKKNTQRGNKKFSQQSFFCLMKSEVREGKKGEEEE